MIRLTEPNLEAALMLSLNTTNSGDNNKMLRGEEAGMLVSDDRQKRAQGTGADAALNLEPGFEEKPVDGTELLPSSSDSAVESESPDETHEIVKTPIDPTAGDVVGHGNSPQPSGSSAQPDSAATDNDTRGLLPVLRNRNFLTLWSGQVFSQLADKVYLVLMIALIENRFQSQDQSISGWVSSIMIAFTIPAVLFGSIAGAYVDRWSKKTVLVLTNLLRGGLVYTLPPLLWLTKDWLPVNGLPVGFCILLGITFLVSTLTQFFAPAEQSAIPLIVERRHLLSANSLYTTTMMASVIIGFAVGEPLLAIADDIAAHLGLTAIGLGKELVVGSGYALAGAVLLLLKTHETRPAPTTEAGTEPPHVFQDIRDGLRYLGQQHRVRGALIQLVILFSVFAALAVLSVRLAEVIPEIKSSQFGFLLAAGGVGMALGATFIGQFGQRFPHARLSLLGSLGMAAALLGLSGFATQLLPALLLITLLGGCAAIVGVPMQTAIQEETPEEMRGKVFGLQNNAINIALSLPLALAGVAETFLGLRVVFLGLAALVVAGGLITWYIARTQPTSELL
jgi:MFS family permease